LPSPISANNTAMKSMIKLEATARIELVYTVLQPQKHEFGRVPGIVKIPVLLLIYLFRSVYMRENLPQFGLRGPSGR